MAAARKLRLKEKRKRKRYILLGVGFVFFVGLIIGSVYVLRLPEVNIASVNVSGAEYTREDLVLQMAEGMLEGSYLFVVPRTNTFFYPKRAMNRDVHSLFPAVKEASFSRIGFTGLSIQLTEREPKALWCQSLVSTSPCYLMDNDGFIFSKIETREDSFVMYTGGVVGEPLASVYFNGRYEPLSAFVIDLAVATNRVVDSVSADEHGDVTVVFKEGGELRFSESNANDTLLDNIASVFASRRFDSGDILEYADFRFGNKIYVKFVEE